MTVNEDEIDLRPYILTVIKSWWLIALLAVLLGGLALAFSLTRPRQYESSATVLLVRSRPTLALAQQFPTVNEPADTNTRIVSMLAIAQSDALASKVIQDFGDQLPPELRDVAKLRGAVKFNTKGDIIQISGVAGNPDLAARIANIWAQQIVASINTAYSGQQPLAEIQGQLKSTRGDYEKAQASLESFIQENKINLLEKQVTEAQSLLNRLGEDRAWRIAYYSNRRQSMEDLRVQAGALKAQLQDGTRSQAGNRGDALAVLLARAEALGINPKTAVKQLSSQPIESLPQDPNERAVNPVTVPEYDFTAESGATLNVQVGDLGAEPDDPASLAADLDGLITLANGEIQRADGTLNNLLNQVTQGQVDEGVATAARQIGSLQTQLEAERARERELTSQRDISWEVYQAMAQKEAEIRNASQTNNQITLVSQAIPPDVPTSRGTIRNTLIAGVLGIILGISIVLAAYWWRTINSQAPVARTGQP